MGFFGSVELFGFCLGFTFIYYFVANIYLVIVNHRVGKMVRESGQMVSAASPIIILQSIITENPRSQVISQEGVRPPPSYFESMEMNNLHQPNSNPPYTPPPQYTR